MAARSDAPAADGLGDLAHLDTNGDGVLSMAERAMPVIDVADDGWSESYPDEDGEPELWVMGGETGSLGDPVEQSEVAPLTSTLTSDDVAGEDWADTSWLDELSAKPTPSARAGQPVTPAIPVVEPVGPDVDEPPAPTADRLSRASAVSEFAGLMGGEDTPTEAAPEPEPEPVAAPAPVDAAPDAQPDEPKRVKPRRGEVSEFLRELSRLALDDED